MDLVQVQAVRLELAKALVALPQDALARRLVAQVPQVELAGEDEPVPLAPDGDAVRLTLTSRFPVFSGQPSGHLYHPLCVVPHPGHSAPRIHRQSIEAAT